MLQRDSVVMMVTEVLVMMTMVMMIPMKPSSIMVTMAMVSPTDFCLPESFLSLCISAPQRRQSLSAILLPILGFREDDIREGALAEVG
jgi:hypothetical protein